jgi:glycosyltransferase involved in cell wall biosynthesis
MDGRILINHSTPLTHSANVPELNGWIPGPPAIHSAGPVNELRSVSLVVPTFFNQELKRRSLQHLLAGIEQAQCVHEIILVASDGENLSFDDLTPHSGGLPVRVVASDPHNRGKSRNAGAAAATSEWLLFLDDDMLLRSWRSIDVLLTRLLEFGYDAALFPRRHYAKFPLLFDPPLLAKTIDEWRRDLDKTKSPFHYDPFRDGARDLPMHFCFPGCFMLMRRDCFLRIKGFAEDFVGWGFEDTEFGQRAIRELHIMNLFRQAEPLLHIDHPVSPYKSDEHNANYQKFYAASESLDINVFCRAVFRGDDFSPSAGASDDHSFVEPFRQLERDGVPVDATAMQPWCAGIARQRLKKHLSPLPKFVALHGSRAHGADDWDDDFDVLALYFGVIQEFYVSDGQPRVEVECADIYRFEHIAEHPAIHSYQGAMELAKVAQARLLWGETAEWKAWSAGVLQKGMRHGWCFWLVLGLGMRLHAAKYGTLVERYFSSLKRLLGCIPRPWYLSPCADIAERPVTIDLCRHALDEFCPSWRERISGGEAIFELQVPEVWTALHRLCKAPARIVLPRPARNGRNYFNGKQKLTASRNGV